MKDIKNTEVNFESPTMAIKEYDPEETHILGSDVLMLQKLKRSLNDLQKFSKFVGEISF